MKNLQGNLRKIVVAILLGVVLLLLGDLNARIGELNRLSQDRVQVAARVTALANQNATLQVKIAYATSDAIVAEWAYSQARLVQGNEDEYLVVIVPSGEAAPTPMPAAPAAPTAMENWEVWLALFIDQARLAAP